MSFNPATAEARRADLAERASELRSLLDEHRTSESREDWAAELSDLREQAKRLDDQLEAHAQGQDHALRGWAPDFDESEVGAGDDCAAAYLAGYRAARAVAA
jgi:hypothetical protein